MLTAVRAIERGHRPVDLQGMSSERSAQCPYCTSVQPLDGRGQLSDHVPVGLAARSLDGERCPATAPVRSSITLGGSPRR